MDYTVLCTCRKCGKKFKITSLDLIAVHLGEYPTVCDSCKFGQINAGVVNAKKK